MIVDNKISWYWYCNVLIINFSTFLCVFPVVIVKVDSNVFEVEFLIENSIDLHKYQQNIILKLFELFAHQNI